MNLYLEALEFDNFLHTIDDENFFVTVNQSNVASMKPSLLVNGIGSSLGIVEIA